MNKRVLFGLFVILFFFMFSEMWIKENQKIIETFEDGLTMAEDGWKPLVKDGLKTLENSFKR